MIFLIRNYLFFILITIINFSRSSPLLISIIDFFDIIIFFIIFVLIADFFSLLTSTSFYNLVFFLFTLFLFTLFLFTLFLFTLFLFTLFFISLFCFSLYFRFAII